MKGLAYREGGSILCSGRESAPGFWGFPHDMPPSPQHDIPAFPSFMSEQQSCPAAFMPAPPSALPPIVPPQHAME